MATQSWKTEFNHVEGTMTHIFSKQVKVVVVWSENTYYTTRNGETIEKGGLDMTLQKYHEMLSKVAKGADELEKLTAP